MSRETLFDNIPFNSLHEFLVNSANQIHNLNHPYLHEKINGTWVTYTYQDILTKVNFMAAWFMEQGLNKGDRVGIIMDNCPSYYVIDQALQKLGLVNVSIYPTLTAEETEFIVNDSGIRILFFGNAFLTKKFFKIEVSCPNVFKTVQLNSELELNLKNLAWDQVLISGQTSLPQQSMHIENRFKSVTKSDLATLIYTSGTTGVPKGAMLSHFNFMSNCYDAKILCSALNKDDLFLSFLPLSHVYERMATYYLTSYIGAQVAFAENIEKVAQNIGEIKPTIMACVPRLLERIHEKVLRNATDVGGIKSKIFFWALEIGRKARLKNVANRKLGLFLSIAYKIANALVFSKINTKLGGRMRLFVSGGGALPPHVGEFFACLGFKVQEGYGLTETSPFVTVNEFERQIYGAVGRVAPSQLVAIQNIESKEIIAIQGYQDFNPDFETEEGEILVKGPNIMQGYWQNKKETDHVFDSEGWFHSGDIGKFSQGYLKITDRLKNMLVTSLGKNIYPTQVETTLLKSSKIDQIFIIGDKREFVSAIVVPNYEEAARDLKISASDFANAPELMENSILENWLSDDLKKYGNELAKFERIKNFIIKSKPFSIESGEMTPKQSIKRKVVLDKYAFEIEKMYA